MTGPRLVVRIVVTLVVILVGVPVLVIGAANLGLDPRHWSGIRLSGVDLSSTWQKCPPGIVNMQTMKYSSADLEVVADRLYREPYLEPVLGGGQDQCHDRYDVRVLRLDHATLAALSKYGDAVAVRLDPTSGHAVLDAASATSEKAPPNDAAGPYRVLAYWLTIEDPVGTWFTLLTGSAATGLEEVSG